MKASRILSGSTAFLILFVIGCADGQRQNHGKRMLKNQPAGRNALNPTNGGKSTSGNPAKGEGSTESSNQKTIEATVAELTAGTETPNFAAGTYQLVSTSTFFSFAMPSDFVQAVVTTTYAPDRSYEATPGRTVAVGQLSTKITEPSRVVGFPLELIVTKVNGNPSVASKEERTFTSALMQKVTDLALVESMGPATDATMPKINLTQLMGSTESINDGQGNVATWDGLQLANGDIRFIIQIEETVSKSKTDAVPVNRNFYLTYRLKPDPTAVAKPGAEAAGRAMTPAEADLEVAKKR